MENELLGYFVNIAIKLFVTKIVKNLIIFKDNT